MKTTAVDNIVHKRQFACVNTGTSTEFHPALGYIHQKSTDSQKTSHSVFNVLIQRLVRRNFDVVIVCAAYCTYPVDR